MGLQGRPDGFEWKDVLGQARFDDAAGHAPDGTCGLVLDVNGGARFAQTARAVRAVRPHSGEDDRNGGGAEDRPEARRLAELRAIDVAVLDFHMGEDAVSFARHLQASGVPLIFCTGSMPEEVHSLFPATPVVAKPFAGGQLLAVVKAAISA